MHECISIPFECVYSSKSGRMNADRRWLLNFAADPPSPFLVNSRETPELPKCVCVCVIETPQSTNNSHTHIAKISTQNALKWRWRVTGACSPPPVDPNVGRSGEPGVEDVDAADAVRSQQRFLERRVVVEPQALPEPVDRINDHHSTGRVLYVGVFSNREIFFYALFTLPYSQWCLKNRIKKKINKEEKRQRFQKSQEKRVYANLAYKRGQSVQFHLMFILVLTEPFP